MKKLLSLILVVVLSVSVIFTGCGAENGAGGDKLKVAMVTDSGTIDDKSFNQGTWEGILRYEEEKGTIEKQYVQPNGEQHTDYVQAIDALVEGGYQVIVTPGFKFETAIYEVASKYPEVKFILIDGSPKNENFEEGKFDNVVSVFFNEHEAGFLAGVSAALSSETGKLGFIGGMEIPPVQKFGWGYQAGVAYANANLGTSAEIVDYIYQGTFNDVAAGQVLAAGMYDKGVDIIFHAAGGVGVGVFNEAKERATNGQSVYVVGVDADKFNQGIYDEGSEASVTLTSALKKVDVAAYNNIDAAINDEFPGGETIVLALADAGVGIPAENPNMSDDAVKTVDEAAKAVLNGEVVVPATEEDLAVFLEGNFTLK
ncbi:BMP family lipoprotein [Vallitalea okinawensis]|uniref:BMP family lipoprotein n=1 Tax=Vallitalea okinawensis TaxID=2078660 RepID=UPI001FA81A67|nr:BMP family ABC transporter substrate-binding protein [Vallitalea okinawensis]